MHHGYPKHLYQGKAACVSLGNSHALVFSYRLWPGWGPRCALYPLALSV